MRRKLSAFIVTVCLCAIIQPQFGTVAKASSTAIFPVDVLIDYGNGTRTWSACILSAPGYDTAFNATQVAADALNYTVSEYGVYVQAINGVWENITSQNWWPLFFWNFTSGNWESSPVGADGLVLSEGDLIAWLYADSWTPNPPADPPITQVEVLLNYGNGTVTWDMVFLTGVSTAFKATYAVADALNYTVSEYGVYVQAINGVWENITSQNWWPLFFWNFTSGNWESSPVGADGLVLSEGDLIAWLYADSWTPNPPIRGDFDGDSKIHYEDIVSFVDAYIAYVGQGVLDLEYREGDMDNDVDIDYDDITSFVDAYMAYWS